MHRYRKQTDSCQRGRAFGVWEKKVKGLRKKKNLIDTDNSMVITKEIGGWGW